MEDQLYDDDAPETTLGKHYPVFEAIKKGYDDLAVKRMREVITRGHHKAYNYFNINRKAEIHDQDPYCRP